MSRKLAVDDAGKGFEREAVDPAKERRKHFGAYLRVLRERAGFKTQPEASAKLGYKSSTVARLEDGTIEPRPEHICELAHLYGEPVDRVVSAFCAVFFYYEDVPAFLFLPPKRVSAEPVTDTPFFLSNYTESWPLADILSWEEGLPAKVEGAEQRDLWIISPEFHDHENPLIRKVTQTLLLEDFEITYFLPRRCQDDFMGFKKQMQGRLKKNGSPDRGARLKMVAVDDPLQGILMNSAVISFPSRIEELRPGSEGFNILRIRDQRMAGDVAPAFGIPLAYDEVCKLHGRVSIHYDPVGGIYGE